MPISDTLDWELVEKTELAKVTANSLSPSAIAAIQGQDAQHPLMADLEAAQGKQSGDETGFCRIAEGSVEQLGAYQYHRLKHEALAEGETADDVYLDIH